MQYLQRAYDLAESRGYFRYPEVLALQDQVPNWFRALGTQVGLSEFENKHNLEVPRALREFYECHPLACFLAATIDGEVFLVDLARLIGIDLPPVIDWLSEKHIVVAFHSHSGDVCAVQTGLDDPHLRWGGPTDPEPYEDDAALPASFSEMVYCAVNNYEQILDHWEAAYKKCQSNPAELRRLGGLAWVPRMPGMIERLKTIDENRPRLEGDL
jgi:hypothetical protein